MGDRVDLLGVDVEAAAEPVLCGAGHDDHTVGERCDLDEHRPLVCCRLGQDGVGDHDGRNAEGAEDRDDLVAVVTPVDAVLVLDDRDVAVVQQVGGRGDRGRSTVVELADDEAGRRR